MFRDYQDLGTHQNYKRLLKDISSRGLFVCFALDVALEFLDICPTDVSEVDHYFH